MIPARKERPHASRETVKHERAEKPAPHPDLPLQPDSTALELALRSNRMRWLLAHAVGCRDVSEAIPYVLGLDAAAPDERISACRQQLQQWIDEAMAPRADRGSSITNSRVPTLRWCWSCCGWREQVKRTMTWNYASHFSSSPLAPTCIGRLDSLFCASGHRARPTVRSP